MNQIFISTAQGGQASVTVKK